MAGRYKEIIGTIIKSNIMVRGIALDDANDNCIIKDDKIKQKVKITSIQKVKIDDLSHEDASRYFPEVIIKKYNKHKKEWIDGYRKAKRADVIKYLLLLGKKQKTIWLYNGKMISESEIIVEKIVEKIVEQEEKEEMKEETKNDYNKDNNWWNNWNEENRYKFLDKFLTVKSRNKILSKLKWEELGERQQRRFSRVYEETLY